MNQTEKVKMTRFHYQKSSEFQNVTKCKKLQKGKKKTNQNIRLAFVRIWIALRRTSFDQSITLEKTDLEVCHEIRTREDRPSKDLNWGFFKFAQSENARVDVGIGSHKDPITFFFNQSFDCDFFLTD